MGIKKAYGILAWVVFTLLIVSIYYAIAALILNGFRFTNVLLALAIFFPFGLGVMLCLFRAAE